MIRRVGPSDVPVLITGESGTGRNWWRERSTGRARERTGPSSAINCGAIPETLLESESVRL